MLLDTQIRMLEQTKQQDSGRPRHLVLNVHKFITLKYDWSSRSRSTYVMLKNHGNVSKSGPKAANKRIRNDKKHGNACHIT